MARKEKEEKIDTVKDKLETAKVMETSQESNRINKPAKVK